MFIPASFLPLLFLGVVLAFLRSSFTNVAEHEPTPQQMILPQPPFCAVPEENLEKLFYFDLGGTYCLCEKQWSNKEYWQKTLSGMAFNFPHLLNGFMAQLIFGNLLVVTFGEFINEFLEEAVVAFSHHWGFNNDPAYDIEPRYDTLMRDVIHCFLGAYLAYEVGHVIKLEPWIRFPIKWNWSVPSSDRQSLRRLVKLLVSGFAWWQCLLLYNADGGINSFSVNNLMCTIMVLLMFAGAYCMNKRDFEESGVNPKRVVTWHVVSGLALAVGCSLSIYPIKSTIYLIMIYEGVLKILTLALELAVGQSESLRTAMGLDPDSDPDSPVWLTQSAGDEWAERGDKGTMELELKPMNAKVGGLGDEDKLGMVNPNHPALETRFQKFLDQDTEENRVMKSAMQKNSELREVLKASFLSDLMERQRQREHEVRISANPLHSEASNMKRVKMLLSLCFGIFFIIIGMLEPMVYTSTDSVIEGEEISVSYGRHWCGNPNGPRDGVNTCHGIDNY